MLNIKQGMKASLSRMICGIAALGLAVILLPGCGGGEKTESAKSSAESSSKKKKKDSSTDGGKKSTPAADAGVGSVTGTIKFDGTAPELMALVEKGKASRDATFCAADAPIPNQSLLVSESNGVANVFVYLSRAPKGAEEKPSSEPVVIDQKGCQFIPHTYTIQIGQELKAINSDPVQHNVHTELIKNKNVNSLIKPEDMTGFDIPLNRAENQPCRVICDIHPWMSAFVLPLDHPFMAITDADGKFEIKDLPVGTHKLKIWHEKAGYLEKEYEVVVEKDKPTAVDLKFGKEKFEVATKDIPGLKTITISSLP